MPTIATTTTTAAAKTPNATTMIATTKCSNDSETKQHTTQPIEIDAQMMENDDSQEHQQPREAFVENDDDGDHGGNSGGCDGGGGGVNSNTGSSSSVVCTKSSPSSSCDFYVNPTILSRLILHQKYDGAVRRLQRYPHEAQIWVCRVRRPCPVVSAVEPLPQSSTNANATATTTTTTVPTPIRGTSNSTLPLVYNPHHDHHHHQKSSNSNTMENTTKTSSAPVVYSYRQLPIHMACQNLGLYDKDDNDDDDRHQQEQHSVNRRPPWTRHWKAALDQLLCRLIIAYPAGCRYADHNQRYPLHDSIRYRASVTVVTLLLTAAPSLQSQCDATGLDALGINELGHASSHRDRVTKLLNQGRIFWEMVRQKAMAQRRDKRRRRRQATKEDASVTVAKNSRDHANDNINDNNSKTLKLSETAASVSLDTETIWSEPTEAASPPPSQQQQSGRPTANDTALGWKQLEQRCILLEQLLTEQMRQTYPLSTQKNSTDETIQSKPPTTTKVGNDNQLNDDPNVCCQQLKATVQQLSRQNHHYQERIAELETHVRDLLWVSTTGSANVSRDKDDDDDDCLMESHAVSSLSCSDMGFTTPTPLTKANQPRGMFGETSIASTILPATSFESRHVVEITTSLLDNPQKQQPCQPQPSLYDATVLRNSSVLHIGGSHGLDISHNFLCGDSDNDDSDSDLDTILAEAELQNGTKLSSKVIRAWKAINVENVDCEDKDDADNYDYEDEEDDDINSVHAVMELDELSASLRGIEFAGSNGPNGEMMEQGSPTSQDRTNAKGVYHMVVTPINE